MLRGVITTKHVLSHPVTLIRQFGLYKYIRLIYKCFESKRHCFADFFLL